MSPFFNVLNKIEGKENAIIKKNPLEWKLFQDPRVMLRLHSIKVLMHFFFCYLTKT